MSPDPIIALTGFFVISLLVWLLWRLNNSPWWFRNILRTRKTLIEDVLKQLFHVEYGGRKASLNAMAGALKISDKSLLKIVEEMSVRNLIKIDHNTLNLTPSGKDYALKIIRVHRLWEKYLSEKTGIHRSEWHDRAEAKEHTLTQEETEKLYRDLGNPRFDPHGDPIPTESGEMIESNWKPLSGLEKDTRATIVHIEDEPDVIYQQIVKSKLHNGSQVKMISSNDHTIEFYSEGDKYSLSPIVASNISVEELDAEVFEENVIRLSALQPGEQATIMGISNECRGAARRRLLDLGFINGSMIETEFESPLKQPKAYSIRNTIIALRDDQAEMILIKRTNE